MKRTMVDQVMVGSATTICNDKTSTLTLNQTKVTKFWLGKVSFALDAHQFHVGAEGALAPSNFLKKFEIYALINEISQNVRRFFKEGSLLPPILPMFFKETPLV